MVLPQMVVDSYLRRDCIASSPIKHEWPCRQIGALPFDNPQQMLTR